MPTRDEIEFEPIIPIGQFILDQQDIQELQLAGGAYYHYKDVCTLLNRKSAENKGQQKWMKWVKASETLDRLPLEKFMHVRDNIGCPRMGNFFKDEEGKICFSVIGTEMYETFIVPFENLWSIEWLDETPQQERNTLQEEVERLREALEKISTMQLNNQSEAEGRFYDCIGIAEEALKPKVTPREIYTIQFLPPTDRKNGLKYSRRTNLPL